MARHKNQPRCVITGKETESLTGSQRTISDEGIVKAVEVLYLQ